MHAIKFLAYLESIRAYFAKPAWRYGCAIRCYWVPKLGGGEKDRKLAGVNGNVSQVVCSILAQCSMK